MPTEYISALGCQFKYISHTHIKVHLWANLTRPLSDGLIHIQPYYKFNSFTYQRFGVDVWLDPCKWLKGMTQFGFIFDWTIGRVLNYSNLNHPCPYDGHIYLKFDNVSVNTFSIEQLLPSGRFRIDGNVTDPTRKIVVASGSIFLSISDHRVERF